MTAITHPPNWITSQPGLAHLGNKYLGYVWVLVSYNPFQKVGKSLPLSGTANLQRGKIVGYRKYEFTYMFQPANHRDSLPSQDNCSMAPMFYQCWCCSLLEPCWICWSFYNREISQLPCSRGNRSFLYHLCWVCSCQISTRRAALVHAAKVINLLIIFTSVLRV